MEMRCDLFFIYFPYDELFSETTVACTASDFVKSYDVFVSYVPPSFEAVYCFICGRRRVVVVRYRMICLVFDPPYFVDKIAIEDLMRDHFSNIILKRYFTKYGQTFIV